jgi:hypothetical protein
MVSGHLHARPNISAGVLSLYGGICNTHQQLKFTDTFAKMHQLSKAMVNVSWITSHMAGHIRTREYAWRRASQSEHVLVATKHYKCKRNVRAQGVTRAGTTTTQSRTMHARKVAATSPTTDVHVPREHTHPYILAAV